MTNKIDEAAANKERAQNLGELLELRLKELGPNTTTEECLAVLDQVLNETCPVPDINWCGRFYH